jgi:hypothetical protein
MANKITFQSVYNNVVSGLFKTNTTKDIGSDDMRALVDSIVANNPFTDDDSYTWASPLTDTSGSNTYTATLLPAIVSYTHGMIIKIRFNATSTAASTLNLNGIGARKIMVSPFEQADDGDIVAPQSYMAMYDSYLDSGTGAFLLFGVAVRKFRGSFDATGTDVYPAANTGSGSGGEILAGDEFRSDPVGDNTDYGGTTSTKTIYKAIVDEPGSDPTKWRII